MMSQALKRTLSLFPATPHEPFTFPFAHNVGPNPDYDVTPDGQRFIMSERQRAESSHREVTLVTHIAIERKLL
jgi:hypothetical protein